MTSRTIMIDQIQCPDLNLKVRKGDPNSRDVSRSLLSARSGFLAFPAVIKMVLVLVFVGLSGQSATAYQHHWYYDYQQGLDLLDNHDLDQAIVMFERALEQESTPQNLVVFDLVTTSYKPYFFIAECHFQKAQRIHPGEFLLGNYRAAVDYYKICYDQNTHRIEVQNDCVGRLTEIAQIMMMTRQDREALAVYRYLNQLTANRYEGITAILQGRDYFEQKEFQAAFQEYSRAIDSGYLNVDNLFSENVDLTSDYLKYIQALWSEISRTEIDLGQFKQMCQKLLGYLSVRSNDHAEKIKKIQQLLGEIALAEKNQTLPLAPDRQGEQVDCLCDCFDSQKSKAIETFNLALNNNDNGLLENAFSLLSDLQNCQVQQDQIYFLRGLIALVQEQQNEATVHFEKALTFGFQGPEILKILALLSANQRKFENAASYFSRYTRTNPQNDKLMIDIYHELISALEFWGYARGQRQYVYHFSKLSPYLMTTLSEYPESGLFRFKLTSGPTISYSFTTKSAIFFLDDRFQIIGSVLDFGTITDQKQTGEARVIGAVPFHILETSTDTDSSCLQVKTTSSENNRTWLLTVTLSTELCSDTELSEVITLRTDLTAHPEISIEVKGRIQKNQFPF